MPRYDRTGPMGAGTGTGRGRGNCGQKPGLSGFAGPGTTGGMSRGRGPGRGGQGGCLGLRGWWQGLWASPPEEAQALKATISSVKAEIAAMEARLAELEKKE